MINILVIPGQVNKQTFEELHFVEQSTCWFMVSFQSMLFASQYVLLIKRNSMQSFFPRSLSVFGPVEEYFTTSGVSRMNIHVLEDLFYTACG